MQRISSRMTFLEKYALPLVVLGFLLLFIAPALASGEFPLFAFVVLPVLLVAAYASWGASGIMDEVWDAGDALIVRNLGREDRIPLTSIMNVDYSPFMPPRRVTLKLRTPSIFGASVAFVPPVGLRMTRRPQIEDVIRRVDAANMHAR
jgi:hypothetical protein